MFKTGDKVMVMDKGLAALRAIVPDAPPNHYGVVDEVCDNGDLVILFDDTESVGIYPPDEVRLRGERGEGRG